MRDSGLIRVQSLKNLPPRVVNRNAKPFQNAGRDAVAFEQKTQQNVFGANVSVMERLGFLGGKGQDSLDARGVWNVDDHLLIGAGPHQLLDFHADGFEIEADFLEDIDGHAQVKLDQTQEDVFSADKVMIEPTGFFPRQSQNLLRKGCKIGHALVPPLAMPTCCSRDAKSPKLSPSRLGMP